MMLVASCRDMVSQVSGMFAALPLICAYPNPFRFFSDDPYEAMWRVSALCAVTLGLVALAIFLLGRRRQSFPWWSLVATIPLLAGGMWGLILAIITGHIAAAQNGMPCYEYFGGEPPETPQMAAAIDAAYNQLVGYQSVVTHTIQATGILLALGLVALLALGIGTLRTNDTRRQIA